MPYEIVVIIFALSVFIECVATLWKYHKEKRKWEKLKEQMTEEAKRERKVQ